MFLHPASLSTPPSRGRPRPAISTLLCLALILAVLPAHARVRSLRRLPLPDLGPPPARHARASGMTLPGIPRADRAGAGTADASGEPGARPLPSEPIGIVLDSTYYDYQGHGALPSRIVAVGDSALHILPYVGEDEALTVRGPKYIYYNDGVVTNYGFVGGGGQSRAGFGAVAGRDVPSGGRGNVAAVTVPIDLPDSLDLNWHAFVDAFQGMGAFTPFTVDSGPEIDPCDPVRYPTIWAAGDGSGAMAMAAMTLADCGGGFPDIVVTHADGGAGGWAPPQVLHTLEDPAAWNAGPEPPILAGADDGVVGVVSTDFGTNVYLWESTDDGVTWGGRESITGYPTTPHTVPPDSMSTEYRPLQGAVLAYDADGEPHVVWTEYQARGTPDDSTYTPGVDPLWQYRTRLMHWSPPQGATVIYRHPAGIAEEAHGTAYAYNVGHPAIGFMEGSPYVYVVFEGFVDADIDPGNGLGFGDIYAALSTDAGATWLPRENVTRSPGVDDLYPSIPRINRQGAYYDLPWLSASVSDLLPDFTILYQSDGAAGTLVQGDEPAPNRDRLLLAAVDAFWITLGGIERDPPGGAGLPRAFTLAQNAPNPFNPATTIAYELPAPARVVIRVHDLRGRRVRTLIAGERDAGRHEVAWDGRDDHGASLSAGVYLCTMEAGEGARMTRKMVMLK